MRNLFNQLFTFRAKENFSAKENFLTEAFAYLLQTDKAVCEAFVGGVIGSPVQIEPGYDVTTRAVERLNGKRCYPDLGLFFRTSEGVCWRIFSEHKWDSEVRSDQLIEYANILSHSQVASEKRLVTIVAQPKQKRYAEATQLCIPYVHFLWEEVYEIIKQAKSREPLFVQFLEFMKTQNLNPGLPIQTETIRAFLASATFKSQLTRYAGKLLNEYDWSIVPEAYRLNPKVSDRWGRVGLEFTTPGWNPTLTVGFLYDPQDHRVMFTAPGESIDLFLRLEADPVANKDAGAALTALDQKANSLRGLGPRVLLRGEDGNGNKYSLLIAQESLGSLIGQLNQERAQIDAIYARLSSWLSCLFEDKSLENALRTLKPFVSSIEPQGEL
jgi:hypothetical protein